MYHYPPATRPTQHVILRKFLNSDRTLQSLRPCCGLAGWRPRGRRRFTFPPTPFSGGRLFDPKPTTPAVLRAKYPGITVLGDFHGKNCLTGPTASDCATPRQPPLTKSPTTTIFPARLYRRRGSSLELRDPRADKSVRRPGPRALKARRRTGVAIVMLPARSIRSTRRIFTPFTNSAWACLPEAKRCSTRLRA